MRRTFAFLLLFAALSFGTWSAAQSGFPSSGQAFLSPASVGSTVFKCQGASSPFTQCAYSNLAFGANIYTVVTKFQPAALSTAAAITAIRLSIRAPSSGAVTVSASTICPAASTGTTALWSCSAAPTPFAWNGSASVVLPTCGTLCQSDRLVFSMSPGQAYTLAFNVNASNTSAATSPGPTTTTPSATTTQFISYSKASVAEAATQTRGATYTTVIGGSGSAPTVYMINQILSVP